MGLKLTRLSRNDCPSFSIMYPQLHIVRYISNRKDDLPLAIPFTTDSACTVGEPLTKVSWLWAMDVASRMVKTVAMTRDVRFMIFTPCMGRTAVLSPASSVVNKLLCFLVCDQEEAIGLFVGTPKIHN